jgi:hypothetical protein
VATARKTDEKKAETPKAPEKPKGPKVYDLNEKTIPLKLIPKGAKEPRDYELRDVVGVDRDAFMTYQSEHRTFDADGNSIGPQDYTDFQAFLISKALWDVEKNEQVALDEIRLWPARVQVALYQQAQMISGLIVGDPGESDEQAGND